MIRLLCGVNRMSAISASALSKSIRPGSTLGLRSTGRLLALAALVGFVAGLGAIVFHLLSQGVDYFAVQRLVGYVPG